MMDKPIVINHTYSIRLCSGETRAWKYLGEGAGGRVWWCDISTGVVFNEASILYAWEMLGEFMPDIMRTEAAKNGE